MLGGGGGEMRRARWREGGRRGRGEVGERASEKEREREKCV